MDGALAEEFSLTLGEMRIGETRHDALKKLAERAAAPEVGRFARAIIQADLLGISLGRILEVQAADTRDRRQAAAEEKAMKAPIKMLFPTVIFIFPAMFLVILGPAMLNDQRDLLGGIVDDSSHDTEQGLRHRASPSAREASRGRRAAEAPREAPAHVAPRRSSPTFRWQSSANFVDVRAGSVSLGAGFGTCARARPSRRDGRAAATLERERTRPPGP